MSRGGRRKSWLRLQVGFGSSPTSGAGRSRTRTRLRTQPRPRTISPHGHGPSAILRARGPAFQFFVAQSPAHLQGLPPTAAVPRREAKFCVRDRGSPRWEVLLRPRSPRGGKIPRARSCVVVVLCNARSSSTRGRPAAAKYRVPDPAWPRFYAASSLCSPPPLSPSPHCCQPIVPRGNNKQQPTYRSRSNTCGRNQKGSIMINSVSECRKTHNHPGSYITKWLSDHKCVPNWPKTRPAKMTPKNRMFRSARGSHSYYIGYQPLYFPLNDPK